MRNGLPPNAIGMSRCSRLGREREEERSKAEKELRSASSHRTVQDYKAHMLRFVHFWPYSNAYTGYEAGCGDSLRDEDEGALNRRLDLSRHENADVQKDSSRLCVDMVTYKNFARGEDGRGLTRSQGRFRDEDECSPAEEGGKALRSLVGGEGRQGPEMKMNARRRKRQRVAG